MRLREIGQDVFDDPGLRSRQRKRQGVNERRDPLPAARQCRRGLGLGKRAQAAQAQVVCQQFFEREALLARVAPLQQLFEIGIGWWAVQVADRVRQRRHAELLRDRWGQQLFGRRLAHRRQRLVGQVTQPALLHAFGRRVDGRQRVVHGGILALAQQPVLGVNHLEAARAAPHLAKTADMHTGLELGLLLAREMKKAQRELATTVADPDQQVAAAAESDLGQQYFAADQATRAGDERADAHELRAVLVAQRQQEQQVLDAVEPELLELPGQRRANALEVR